MIVYQYIWFSSCPKNIAFISISVVFGIAFYAVVPFRTRSDASLLTSSFVLSYILYLQWSAMSSDDINNFCFSESYFRGNYGISDGFKIGLGCSFTFVSLLVISASTREKEEANVAVAVNEVAMEDAETHEVLEDLEEPNGGKKMTAEEMHVFPVTRGIIVFQALLIFASIYYSMLLTNWGNPYVKDSV